MKYRKHYIDIVLQKEKQRNELMRSVYEKRISSLPRGSLIIRELNGRKYCYLRYRDGKRVVQKYAGKVEQAELISSKIEERKHLEKLILMLEEEQRRIERMEAIK